MPDSASERHDSQLPERKSETPFKQILLFEEGNHSPKTEDVPMTAAEVAIAQKSPDIKSCKWEDTPRANFTAPEQKSDTEKPSFLTSIISKVTGISPDDIKMRVARYVQDIRNKRKGLKDA